MFHYGAANRERLCAAGRRPAFKASLSLWFLRNTSHTQTRRERSKRHGTKKLKSEMTAGPRVRFTLEPRSRLVSLVLKLGRHLRTWVFLAACFEPALHVSVHVHSGTDAIRWINLRTYSHKQRDVYVRLHTSASHDLQQIQVKKFVSHDLFIWKRFSRTRNTGTGATEHEQTREAAVPLWTTANHENMTQRYHVLNLARRCGAAWTQSGHEAAVGE